MKKNITTDSSAIKAEQGIALVVALGMLVLLGILGTWALSTSTMELQIVGNYRTFQEAFYAADAVLEYAQTDPNITSAIQPTPGSYWPTPGAGTSTRDDNFNVVTIGNNVADVRVEYLYSGQPPPGSADPDKFQAFYYVVTSVGQGPNGTEVIVESQIAELAPK